MIKLGTPAAVVIAAVIFSATYGYNASADRRQARCLAALERLSPATTAGLSWRDSLQKFRAEFAVAYGVNSDRECKWATAGKK